MYDMKPMAESLASQGRYGDSMLVHMNPVEVAGLRAAAQKMGGDLTTNPRTGQPEAFLPFLLGMGLQGLGMSALGAGIATGLGTAAVTKDLGQGLMAGLGAYGGAGIGEGLSAASVAQPTTSTAMISDLGTGVPDLSVGTGGFGGASLPSGAAVSPTQLVSQPPISDPTMGIGGIQQVGQAPSAITLNTALPTQSFAEPSTFGGLQSVMGSGAEGAAAREAFMEGVGGTSGLLKYGAAGLAPYAFEQPGVAGYEGQRSLIRPFDYDPETREFTERTPYAAPGPEYMADGGIVERNQYNYDPNTQMFSKPEPVAPQVTNPLQSTGGAFSQMGSMFGGDLRPFQRATMNSDDPDTQRVNQGLDVFSEGLGSPFNVLSKIGKRNKNRGTLYEYSYDPQTQMFTEVPKMAQGGLTGYKEGNILRGQGDGMSDEIEASIGGEQDVLLSDGEYVVPADAVAMLGNGSTDAGANRLDEMIARLRMKKYGRDKQPPEMKAESVMPV